MICEKCGAQLRDGVKFCTECGARLGDEGGERPNPAPQGNYNPNMNYGPGSGYNNPPIPPYGVRPGMNQGNYGYGAPQQQKKSSALPLIIILIAAAAAAVLIIFFVMRSRNGGDPGNGNNTSGYSGNTSSAEGKTSTSQSGDQTQNKGKYTIPSGAKVLKNATLEDLEGEYEGEWNFTVYEADPSMLDVEDGVDIKKVVDYIKSTPLNAELIIFNDGAWELDIEDFMTIWSDDYDIEDTPTAVKKGSSVIEKVKDGNYSLSIDIQDKVENDPDYGTGTLKAHIEHTGTLYEKDGKKMISGFFSQNLDTPKGKVVTEGTFTVQEKEQKPFVEENNMKITSADTIFKAPAYYFAKSNGNEIEIPGLVFEQNNASYRFYDYRVIEQNDEGYQTVSFKYEATVPKNLTLAADPGFSWAKSDFHVTCHVFDYYTGEKYKNNNVNIKEGEENTNKEFKYTDITFNDKTYRIGVRSECTVFVDGENQVKNADGSTSYIGTSHMAYTYYIYAPKDYDGLMVGLYKNGASKETYHMYVEYNNKFKELKAQADAGNPSEEYKKMQAERDRVKLINEGEFSSDSICDLSDYYVIRVKDIPKAAQ